MSINRRKFLTLFGIGAVAAPTVAVAVAEDLANVPARVLPAATGGVIRQFDAQYTLPAMLSDGEYVIPARLFRSRRDDIINMINHRAG